MNGWVLLGKSTGNSGNQSDFPMKIMKYGFFLVNFFFPTKPIELGLDGRYESV